MNISETIQLREDVKTMSKENKKLAEQYDALHRENVKLTEQYDELKGEYEAVCADRDAERTNAEVWREKYEKLSVEMEQWQGSKDLRERNENQYKYIEELNAQLTRANGYLDEYCEQAMQLKKQLECAEEQRKSAETALLRMKEAADIAEKREASAKAASEGAHMDCQRLITVNDELRGEVDRLQYREKQLQAAIAEICIRAFCGGEECE